MKKQEAVIYCRVSHPSQVTRGNGLEGQETSCRQYAKRTGYIVTGVFREPGISGGIMDRPMMRELLEYLEKRPATAAPIVVIIDDIKRLARDAEGHLILRRTIYSRNARLESPTHRFEDTPGGRFVEIVLAGAAQLEREQNKEQVKRRMKARLEAGFWCFPDTLPGLKYKHSKIHGKVMRQHEPEASVVTEALEGFANGRFPTQVALRQFLQEKKLYSRVYTQHVRRLLDRALVYAGYLEYEPWGVTRRKGQHDALINLQTYELIQQRLHGTVRQQSRQDANPDFPHRGFVTCASCQKLLTASWCKGRSAKYPRYWCHHRNCAWYGKAIARENLETQFVSLLQTIQPEPATVGLAKAILLKKWDVRMQQVEEREQEIKKEITTLTQQINDCLNRAVQTNSATVARAYEAKIEQLENQKLLLEEKVLKVAPDRFDFRTALTKVIDFLQEPSRIWKNGDLHDRHRVLQMVFQPPLAYAPKEGFRTANFSLTFATISGISVPEVTGCEVYPI